MDSERIDSNTFKSYNSIVGQYLHGSIKRDSWMPSNFTSSSLQKLVGAKESYSLSLRNTLVEAIKSQYHSSGIMSMENSKIKFNYYLKKKHLL